MIVHLVLFGTLLAGQANLPANEQTQAEVRQLVRQLDAAQLADRDDAEAELLRRGPAILGLLPPASERTTAEVSQRLGRIRQKLQQADAEATIDASTITLQADAIPLSPALAAIQEQSGNSLIDHREKFGQPVTNPTLKLHFDKTPFWQALDQLLDQAGMTVYPFPEQRAIGVVDALGRRNGSRMARACYCGPFRFEAVRVLATRESREAGGESLRVTLEVAWEPRLKVIYFLQRMADVEASDEHGRRLPVANAEAQLEVPISGNAPAVELSLPLQLPPRNTEKIASLKGALTAVMAGKIETFRFGNLAREKNVEQRIAGATVALEPVRKTAVGWEVRMRVRFDNPGDALASHRTWIFSNEAWLEGPDSPPIHPRSFDTTAQTKNEVGVAFQFDVDRPINTMAFVYKTPSMIVSRQLEYELCDITLP